MTSDDEETTLGRSTYRQTTGNKHAVNPSTHLTGVWVGHLQGKNSFTLKMETESEILVPQHALSPGTHLIGVWVSHLQGKNSSTLKMETATSSELLVPLSTTLHCVTSRKSVIFIVTAVRTYNLTLDLGSRFPPPCQLPSPAPFPPVSCCRPANLASAIIVT
jgi:hypothetical protein